MPSPDAKPTSTQYPRHSPWFKRLITQPSGFNSLRSIYKSIGPTQGPVDFASRALSTLHIECSASEQSLARVPCSGRVIIVANHPFGALDGLAAIRIIGARRPDLR